MLISMTDLLDKLGQTFSTSASCQLLVIRELTKLSSFTGGLEQAHPRVSLHVDVLVHALCTGVAVHRRTAASDELG